jgi:hypothetical protein
MPAWGWAAHRKQTIPSARQGSFPAASQLPATDCAYLLRLGAESRLVSLNKTTQRPSVTLPGIDTTIDSPHPSQPGTAQISIENADGLVREIRIENSLQDKDGGDVSLKPGARVQVTINAEQPATIAKA